MIIRKESYRRGIVLSTVFNFVSKGLIFFNIILIAYFFGTSLEVDIYFYSYNLILLMVTYLSSINSSVLIPEAIRLRNSAGEKSSMEFLNTILFFYFSIIFVVTIIVLFDPAASFASVSKYDIAALNRNRNILYLVTPLLVLMTVTTLLSDILVSYRFFTMPMVVACINAILSMISIIFLHETAGIQSALFGLIVSYLLNISILMFLMRRHLNWRINFQPGTLDKRVFKNIGYAQFGNLASALGTYAPIYFLSGWQAGVISALNYAQQVFNQPTALFTNQVTAISRIKLNELFVRGEKSEINANFLVSLRLLLFILVPVSCLMFMFSDEIIGVFFNRGSFGKESAELATIFLKYLSLAIPLIAINNIVANLFFVSQLLRLLVFYQVVSNLLMAVLIYFGLQMLGPVGFPLAFGMTYLFNVGFLFLICRRAFPFIRFDKAIVYLLKIIGINLMLYFSVTLLYSLVDFDSAFIRLFSGSLIYIVILGLINERIKLNLEISDVIKKLFHRVSSLAGR